MKTIKLIILFTTFSISTYSQSKCADNLLTFTSSLDPDSLKVDFNLILSIKDYEDIPFYEEYRFTSSPKDPQYFLIKKMNPEASLGYKVFDWDNTEIETQTIQQKVKGESLITLRKHQSGNYKLVLYSKDPDGSCISLSKLKRKKAGEIKIPSSKLNQNTDLKALTLLKEYNVNIKTDDLPVLKEYSYVLTKGTDYYFYWEKNENLKLRITNSKREEQLLESFDGNNKIEKINCEKTGIYYFIIYAKEAKPQESTLKFYFDEQSRKSN
ncbi:hypothetical protein [Marivirga sp.]|uniref:hypothetical protein n=1 Tax=Marivirga sp. TaxID=2018662 RepID=UPI0025F46BCB|nr:hypothetical protein [Marivirga sp.]